jgi:hypothetical protein
MPLRIEIVEGHNIYAFIAEITAFSDDEILPPAGQNANYKGEQEGGKSFHIVYTK